MFGNLTSLQLQVPKNSTPPRQCNAGVSGHASSQVLLDQQLKASSVSNRHCARKLLWSQAVQFFQSYRQQHLQLLPTLPGLVQLHYL
eukprot:g2915.t1